MLGLAALLPLAGLQTYTRPVLLVFLLWLICAASAFLATSMAGNEGRAALHTGVSLYLYVSMLIMAAFVANDPVRHTRLILNAGLAGALIAAIAGIVGYFDALPGAHELFTKFGRAAGTFKDPNVFGPFLVPAILYAMHLLRQPPAPRALLPLAACLVLCLAMLLSFSRGAWLNLAVSFGAYAYLNFLTAPSNRSRLGLLFFAGLLPLLAGIAVFAVLQIDAVSALFSERSNLANDYDIGPDGRFGGHLKAAGLMLENPLGLGALEFAAVHHHEDVHNVYLSMFLNAGWLGGLLYIAIVLVTLGYGFRQTLRRSPTQSLLIIVYAALIGNVLEGFVVDSDHWRHFYLQLAIVWGLLGTRAGAGEPRTGSLLPVAPRR
jgi:O-antigen ligase